MEDLQPQIIASTYLRGDPSPVERRSWSSRLGTLLTDIVDSMSSSDLTVEERLAHSKQFAEQGKHTLQWLYDQSQHSPASEVTLLLLTAVAFPELSLGLGFDEVRFSESPVKDPTLSDSVKNMFAEALEESQLDMYSIELATRLFKMTQFRSPDGVWHDLEGLIDAVLPSEKVEQDFNTEAEWADGVHSLVFERLKTPHISAQKVIALPKLQFPSSYGDTLLHTSTKAILHELQNATKHIDDLHWRTLEELVAELLFGLGLDVTITERSNDGGRDVIARGELIPGEPMLLAVEVKHRKKVPVSEVRQALWANRHFPALLFVTSGDFSAGVYNERHQNEGALRLFLKNGVGLTQWIDSYCQRQHPNL